MVGHESLRKIVGPDPLRAIARTDHRFASTGALVRQSLSFHFEQAGSQHLQRLRLVLVLRLLVLLDDYEAGRKVGDPDRAVSRVDGLAAGTRRAIDVDAEVLIVDLDVDILGLG